MAFCKRCFLQACSDLLDPQGLAPHYDARVVNCATMVQCSQEVLDERQKAEVDFFDWVSSSYRYFMAGTGFMVANLGVGGKASLLHGQQLEASWHERGPKS